jgi:predicted permease
MDSLRQDLSFAARALARSPGFTMLAVLCLAVGIGVNSMMFSVVNGALLRPLPFAEPEQLVVLKSVHERSGIDDDGISYLDYRDWREAGVFAAMGAYAYRSLTIQGRDEPERVLGAAISASLFPMLGARPELGRLFRADEDQPGAQPVVILGDGVWRRRFDGDPRVIGQAVVVNGVARTVIGIMPPRFAFPQEQEMWVPIAPMEHASPRLSRDLTVMARLAPGTTRPQAEAALDAVTARLDRLYPATNAGWRATVWPLRREFVGEETQVVIVAMMGAVVLVLLIACANVANLLLARGTARAREIAIRVALGAGRRRVVRQLLTESVLVALGGAVLGALVAAWGVELLLRSIRADDPLPYYISFQLEQAELAFTIGVALATALVFGLAPAWRATGGPVQDTLREGGRTGSGGRRQGRLRNALVVAEVSLSVVLLVAAALMVRSFVNLERASTGFDTGAVMTMRFYMPGERYDAPGAMARRTEDLVRRLEALPGVESAAASNLIPFDGGGDVTPAAFEGRPAAPGEEPQLRWAGVSAHWLGAVGIRPVAGRTFTDAEGSTRSQVAVVNQAFARKHFDGDALGRRFRFTGDTAGHWLTVVGVIPDVKLLRVNRPVEPLALLPYPYMEARNTGLVIRAGVPPASVTSAVRAAIRDADAALPLFDVATLDDVRARSYWQYGLFGGMFAAFAAIALLLAVVGVYGVVSYAVGQRTREIGVRVALGAQRRDVMRLVVGEGARLALIGVAAGLLGAAAVTRVIAGLLYDVSSTDPASFVAIATVLTGAVLLASYIPARRAMRVDPVEALRTE